MPTIQQLVRKGRQTKRKEVSTAALKGSPAATHNFISLAWAILVAQGVI